MQRNLNLKGVESLSSTEIQKNWGRTLRTSLKKAVVITQHEEATHAIISIDEFLEYQKLKNGMQVALHINELTEEDFQAIMDAEVPPEHDPEKKK